MQRLGLLIVPFLVASCSTDTFSSIPEDGGDAAVSDAAPLEGASPPDGGPIDGALEAAVDAGRPPPLNCGVPPNGDATFCADFNGTGVIDEGWSSPFTLNGGAAVPNTNKFYSASRSLETMLPVASGITYATLYYNHLETATRTHYLLSFAFQVVSPGDVRIARFEYTATGAPKARLDVTIGPGSEVDLLETAVPNDGGAIQAIHKLGAFALGSWHTVVLDFKLTSPMSTSASFDGVTQVLPSALPLPATNGSKTRDIFIGTYASSGTGAPVDVLFDDVLYRSM